MGHWSLFARSILVMVFVLPHWTCQWPRAQRKWAFTLLGCDITYLVPAHYLGTLGQSLPAEHSGIYCSDKGKKFVMT